MSEEIGLVPQPIMDPRGVPPGQPLALAPRRASWQGAKIALLDNGKLAPEYGPFGALYEVLEGALAERLGAVVLRLARDLLLGPEEAVIAQAAQEIRAAGGEGVVLALGDAGVTQRTARLAMELEKEGLPTVTICTDLGLGLAQAMAQFTLPGLPLCEVALLRTATAPEIREAAEALIDEVLAALTLPAQELKRRFEDRFGPAEARLKADARGELCLGRERIQPARRGKEGRLEIELDPGAFAEEIYEALDEKAQVGDGLPIIPPTRERVERMLRFTDRPPQEIIAAGGPPSGAPLTVEKLAVTAVMAGCRPEYFPIVLTACQAMAEGPFRLAQAVITTNPSGTAVLVSGPLAQELSIQASFGCLGPGFRANATIGRAVSMWAINICRALPGRGDLSTLGSPAEYAYCFAENEAQSPWPALHTELYGPEVTTVTVHKCEGPHNALDHLSVTPEGILTTLASVAATLGANNAYMPAELLVILNPEHAHIIAQAGWAKSDVRRFLYEKARNPAAALRGRGIVPGWPKWFYGLERVPIVAAPEEIIVVVAGGPGPHSMVAIPWGYARAVTKPVAFRDGRPVRSVQEFVKESPP